MNELLESCRANWTSLLAVCAVAVSVAGGAVAAAPPAPADEAELLNLGFKELVATTPTQEEWVKRLAPGQIRALQRTGRKYFIYPDAPRKRIFVGGPKEYEAFRQLHPDSKLAGQDGAKKASDYRAKQDTAMKKATAHDLSDPYYWVNTATWADLGW